MVTLTGLYSPLIRNISGKRSAGLFVITTFPLYIPRIYLNDYFLAIELSLLRVSYKIAIRVFEERKKFTVLASKDFPTQFSSSKKLPSVAFDPII